jgi:type II secretory pathway component PulJ
MSLLECLVGLALSLILVSPLIRTSGEFIAKQIEYEKRQSLTFEAERAMELIGRSIRMAGYRNAKYFKGEAQQSSQIPEWIVLNKGGGYHRSDSLVVQHELSHGLDYDCIGNALTIERTKNHLAIQGFLVEHQAGTPKGVRANGGSLICQSLDRQGRMQKTTLMNGVDQLSIEELPASQGSARLFKVRITMTDGQSLQREWERVFATRNLL